MHRWPNINVDIDINFYHLIKYLPGEISTIGNNMSSCFNIENSIVTGNLSVTKTASSIKTRGLSLVGNFIYANSDNVNTGSGTPASLVVNYLATSDTASVAGAGFTAGVVSTSNPTVVTNNGFAWSAGDIIQITGANSLSNEGLFEVNSYSNPTLTIRGVGITPTTFNFFRDNFKTDSVAIGTITKVNISVISSGPDGLWELTDAPQSTTIGMTFKDIITSTTTLSSLGGTSLVGTGTGPSLTIKGLSDGGGVTITDNGTDLSLSVAAVTNIWQESSGIIRPISSVSNGLLCGLTSGAGANAIVSGTQCIVAGGSGNSAGNSRNAVVGGSDNTSGSSATDSVVVGGTSNSITPNFGSSNNVICGGTLHSMVGNVITNNFIGGGENNTVNANNSDSCAVIGGINNIARRLRNVAIGGTGNTVGNTGNETPTDSVIVGGTSNSITPTGTGPNNVICGGTSHTMNNNNLSNNFIAGGTSNSISTNNSSNNIVLGSNINASGSGSFAFSDSAGGTALTTGNNRFRVRCSGGAWFFTNTANSAGVTLAAGGGSWTMISDVNKKENLEELNYSNILEKIDSLPIYKYNYISTEKERICYGPTAQDWYDPSRFICENVEVPSMVTVTKPCLDQNGDLILDKDGNPLNSIEEVQAVDKDGNLQFEKIPAKDNLSIEINDMIGISLACDKELITICKKQQKMIEDLQVRLAILEARLM